MYSVLVVDDEIRQREAVIGNVDWQRAGFEVVGGAENGIEALDLLEKLEPDLVLTDIKMPLMTGLELAKRTREIRPATKFVILSGYDDFEYAQEAFKYNVIRYLLKPVSASELTEEFEKIGTGSLNCSKAAVQTKISLCGLKRRNFCFRSYSVRARMSMHRTT